MLHAVGFTREDFKKSQIGICSTWSQVTPCNVHIDDLARHAAAGAGRRPARRPVIFNTITISDAISMGTEGMKYSLVSREVIADSIETVAGAEGLRWPRRHRRLRQEHAGLRHGDGAPESAVGVRLRRHDHAGRAGATSRWTSSRCSRRSDSTRRARSTDADLADLEAHACPGPGSCGGMYTANTMASRHRGARPEPAEQLRAGGDLATRSVTIAGAPAPRSSKLIERGIRPRDILTKKAFENAITTVIALGGSTNAVLHLLAIAHAAGVRLTIDDFTRIGKRVPGARGSEAERPLRDGGAREDRRPHAAHADAARQGPAARRRLTVTGQTLAENLKISGALPGRAGRRAQLRRRRSRRTAISSCCTAISRPTARWPRSAARKGERFTGKALRLRSRRGCARRHSARPRQEGPRDRHPLRGPARRSGHARDAVADERHHGPRPRARMWRSSPTAASAAARTASSSATSRRRPTSAGPLAVVKNGDTITIDAARAHLDARHAATRRSAPG